MYRPQPCPRSTAGQNFLRWWRRALTALLRMQAWPPVATEHVQWGCDMKFYFVWISLYLNKNHSPLLCWMVPSRHVRSGRGSWACGEFAQWWWHFIGMGREVPLAPDREAFAAVVSHLICLLVWPVLGENPGQCLRPNFRVWGDTGCDWGGERWLEAGSWELAKASLTVDIQEVLCHDHWPLVNGFAWAVENPTWGWMRGLGECSGPALGLSLLLTLHTTTSSHLSLLSQYTMSPCPQPSALSDPQGAGYSDFLLGGLPSSPGNLYRQDLGWDNDSNKGFLELERGESQGWQILGEN